MRYRYERIFWIDASNKDALERSYKALRFDESSDKIRDANRSIKVALRELECCKRSFLLIFDGADNLEEIKTFWPPGGYAIFSIPAKTECCGDFLYPKRRTFQKWNIKKHQFYSSNLHVLIHPKSTRSKRHDCYRAWMPRSCG